VKFGDVVTGTAQLKRIKEIAYELHEHGFHSGHDRLGSSWVVRLPLNHHNLWALSESKEGMPSGEGRERIAQLQKRWDSGEKMPEVTDKQISAGVLEAIQASHGFARFVEGRGLKPIIAGRRLILMPRAMQTR
jgi:hypothetical protein